MCVSARFFSFSLYLSRRLPSFSFASLSEGRIETDLSARRKESGHRMTQIHACTSKREKRVQRKERVQNLEALAKQLSASHPQAPMTFRKRGHTSVSHDSFFKAVFHYNFPYLIFACLVLIDLYLPRAHVKRKKYKVLLCANRVTHLFLILFFIGKEKKLKG